MGIKRIVIQQNTDPSFLTGMFERKWCGYGKPINAIQIKICCNITLTIELK